MSHNYYLYHDPATDQLVWISWDHNEAFSNRGRGDTSLDKASIGANWPLIRYLLDDLTYQAKYVEYLRSTITDAFVADEVMEKIDTWAELMQPYVAQEGNAQAFASAVTQLKTFAAARVAAVEAFLANP